MKRSSEGKTISRQRLVSGHLVSSLLGSSIKFTFRKLKAQKGFSFLNIACLSVGMACCIILALWIQHEMSFDRFHENKDRIFRIVSREENNRVISSTSLRFAQSLKENLDEIESYCRIRTKNASLVKYLSRRVHEQRFYLADSTFFQIFTFPFIAGNPETAFSELDSIVLTEETASRYFGKTDPIGKILHVLQFDSDFKVTGVIKNIPCNSHLQFDLISRIEWMGEERLESWDPSGFSYLMLGSSANPQDVSLKIVDSVRESEIQEFSGSPFLQPLRSIHTHEMRETGSGKKVYMFSALAVFILILTCINFTNLSTARSIKTAKEVGIRKVIGGTRKQIIFHFLGESLILSLLAFISSIMLVLLTLPAANRFFGIELKFVGMINILFLLVLVGLVLITTILAGSYPAVFLSSFRPSNVLKGKFILGRNGIQFRKILITFQFSVAIGFIICSLIVHKQLRLIKEKDLGFNQDSVVMFTNDKELKEQFEKFKQKLLEESDILNVTASSSRPILARDEVKIRLKDQSEDISFRANYTMVDFDFFKTFEMELVLGRQFLKEFPEDKTKTCVINESAAREMGIEFPLGKTIYFDHPDFAETYKELEIIGVVRDFHFQSMHQANRPFVFRFHRPWHFSVFIRMKPGNVRDTLARIEFILLEFRSHQPFYYEFFDDTFQELYKSEIQQGFVFNFTGIMAILISCLSLFGLSSYIAEQKTKEIGIRKVFGATVPGIVYSLSKEFTQGVLLANLITWPIVYFIMNKWLQNFAYRINLGLDVFIVSAFFTLFIALFTVVFRAIKAATADPIEALRYE